MITKSTRDVNDKIITVSVRGGKACCDLKIGEAFALLSILGLTVRCRGDVVNGQFYNPHLQGARNALGCVDFSPTGISAMN